MIIIGSKGYKNINLNNIIDTFDKNLRFNMSLPYHNNGTKCDELLCNNHVYKFLQKHEYTNFDKEQSINLIKKINLFFFPEMEKYVRELENITKKLNLKEDEFYLYKSYFQNQLHHLLMPSPFLNRMYLKPLGYPGDFKMMKMIYENAFEGPTLFSILVNKHCLENNMAKANRNRNRYLSDKLKVLIENQKKPSVDILSVASGPALELGRLIRDHTNVTNKISVTLLDQEIEALKFSQENIYEKRIEYESNLKVDFIHKDIGSFLKDNIRSRSDKYIFDIIYFCYISV